MLEQNDNRTSNAFNFDNQNDFDIEDFEIDPKDTDKFLLGKGSFATVYKTRFRKNGQNYAMKVVVLKD